jgi:hypothetical protein
VSDQPEFSEKRKRKTFAIVPAEFAMPFILNADKIGDNASGAVLSGVKRFGTAGTGAKISELTGFYADRAARAAVGGGPKLSGGKGITGGNAKLDLLAKLTTAVVVIAAGTYVVTHQRPAQVREKEPIARGTVACTSCGEPLIETDAEPQVSAECPACEQSKYL